MDKPILLILLLFVSYASIAQEIPPETEQQLEEVLSRSEDGVIDEEQVAYLAELKRNPIDLNNSSEEEILNTGLIDPIRVSNLIIHRNKFGKLIHIYELQSIPGWDIPFIKKILPYIRLGNELNLEEDIKNRIRKADQFLLVRISKPFLRNDDLQSASNSSIMLRYRLQYKDLFSFGFTAEKDAGEKFDFGKRKLGFDFYSGHLFLKKAGPLESIVVGDYTINMGQGLIHSQSGSFGKGADITKIKLQMPALKPYPSVGEFLFHRGIAFSFNRKRIIFTMFASRRMISASTAKDSVGNINGIRSINVSGYHRTDSEISGRRSVSQFYAGSIFKVTSRLINSSLNLVYSSYSVPIEKKEEPFNLFSIAGKHWINASIDYNFTKKNFHFFGESAIDMHLNLATLNGLMMSVDPSVDISMLVRCIPAKYQSMQGSAFTENSKPTNEAGLYTGISVRPFSRLQIDAYVDLFRNPWLRYRADAPTNGKDLFVQLTYSPTKTANIHSRFRVRQKNLNNTDGLPIPFTQKNWRTHLEVMLNKAVTFRSRMEFVRVESGETVSKGFAFFSDILFRPPLKPYSGGLRFMVFDSDSYDSRIYAFENDVLYTFSIRPFHQKGYRFYINLHYEFDRIQLWMKISQTIFSGDKLASLSNAQMKTTDEFDSRLQLKILL